ncbi:MULTISPECIES: energy-coupling factor transporter transmembrane component T [Actinosynnema]|uniref:energy-coupling factor transporter transmembrane component T family protein n=1 Tax=Actinosynnema TaxID=40566 RepID=UPI0020A29308|nr:energy-coupling factor transporter transmembrane component T [Actinosynnema pretiosum]MCP2097735.1 energy-coupling factor transport system permease protein [Actinosynnema pretiosum]
MNSWTRLNPLTRLAAALTTVVVAFCLPLPWWPPLLLLVLLPVAALAGVIGRFLRLLVVLVGPLAVLVFLLQGMFYPDGVTVLLSWGPVSVTEEGLEFATLTAGRVLVLVGATLLLALTTHPGALMGALVQRGLSPKTSYVISATLQIVPAFRARAQGVLRAQQARGLDTGTLRKRAGAVLPLAGPLLLGALADLDERAVAMEARAFGSNRRPTALIVVPDSRAQRLARLALGAVAVTALVVNVLGVLR